MWTESEGGGKESSDASLEYIIVTRSKREEIQWRQIGIVYTFVKGGAW